MPVLGNLFQGLLGALTAPKNTTAQYTGGYNPGTNGMVDPGVNNNQPVGPSWSPTVASSAQQRWNQIFDPQANQMLMQNNLQGQNAQLANMIAMGQQNNVMPNQLGGLQSQMGSTAMSGLQAKQGIGQAQGLQSYSDWLRTKGGLGLQEPLGYSTAMQGLTGADAGTSINLNNKRFADASAPYQNQLAQILANTQMATGRAQGAGAGLDLTRANQTQQYLNSDPNITANNLKQQSAYQQAETDRLNRETPYSPGSTTSIFGPGNTLQGSLSGSYPSMDIGSGQMQMKHNVPPVYTPNPQRIVIPRAQGQDLINSQQPPSEVPQLSTYIPARESGVASGGVGQAQVQQPINPAVINAIKQLLQGAGPIKGLAPKAPAGPRQPNPLFGSTATKAPY